MLPKPAIIFILFVSEISQNSAISTQLISVTTELIDSLKIPLEISAYVCWDVEKNYLLWKNLASKHNFMFLTKIKKDFSFHHLFIVDSTCNGSFAILKQAEEMKLFKNPFKWVILGKTENLQEFYFGIDSQVYVINSDSHDITIVYKYSSTSKDFVEDYVTPLINYNPVKKRTTLNGTNIKISMVAPNPDTLNHLTDYRNRHIDTITKLSYNLINNLMDHLSASTEFVVRSTWGYKNATTGVYSGMVGDLQIDNFDVGGTALFFTVDRIDIIDYVATTTSTYMTFIFRAPPLSTVTNVFTLPFTASVWHYCFVMVAIVVVCIYIIVLWEWKTVKFRKKVLEKQTTVLRPKVFDVIMLQIGAITQQGTDVEPKSIAGRIITIFTFATLMFLYTAYSANVVALLQSTTDSIKTLDDLLHSKIKLGVEDIVYAYYYFENAQEPVRKAIYQQKIAPKGQTRNFMKAEEGIRRVQEGFFGFHVDSNTGYRLISDTFQEQEKCGLKEIAYVNLVEPWFAIQKNSPYKEIIKIGMKKMHESGIKEREAGKLCSRKPQCHAGGNNFGSVGMVECYSAFLIFATGVAFSILLLILELILKNYFCKPIH